MNYCLFKKYTNDLETYTNSMALKVHYTNVAFENH